MDITLTLNCNNNCVFCPRRDYLRLIACCSLKEAFNDIEKTRKASNKIVLSGGEATILKEIWDILDFCCSKNFKEIGIVTNARALKDSKAAERFIRAGINDFAISLYSFDDKIHDKITRKPGSAEETKKGILNLLRLFRKYPIRLRINIVLNYWNSMDIFNTLSALFRLGIRNFIIAEQIIINRHSRHLSSDKIKDFLAKVRQVNLENSRLCLRGFPFCFFDEPYWIDRQGVILRKTNPFIVLENQSVDSLVKETKKKKRYFRKFESLFTKTTECRNCIFQGQCLGIQKAYL